MNKEKISSQEIIDLVALKASVSKRSSEEFLKVMISTIEDALLAGESVKIKNFGTFKLHWNEPRKSVNVQTGEDIIIKGFYKVNFSPDTILKDLVNEPFSHLETVRLDGGDVVEDNVVDSAILNEVQEPLRIFTEQASEIKNLILEIQALSATQLVDEVVDNDQDDDLEDEDDDEDDFGHEDDEVIEIPDYNLDDIVEFTNTDINKNIPESSIDQIIEEISESIAEINSELVAEEISVPELDYTNVDFISDFDNTFESGEIEEYILDSPIESNEQINDSVTNVTEISEEIETPNYLSEDVTLSPVLGATSEESVSTDENDHLLPQDNESDPEFNAFLKEVQRVERKKKTYMWLVIVVVLLIGSAVVIYNYSKSITEKTDKIFSSMQVSERYEATISTISGWFKKEIKPDVVNVVDVPQAIVMDQPVDSTKLLNSEISQENIQSTEHLNNTDQKPVEEVKSIPKKKSPPVDSLQILFDTPRVYPEFIATVTIGYGSRLTLISQKYYGTADFWVYIYEANSDRFENPDQIKSGSLIYVPKIDPRLIDASNPRCIKKAKELHDLYVKR